MGTLIFGLRSPDGGDIQYIGCSSDIEMRLTRLRWDCYRSTPVGDWLREMEGEPIIEILDEADTLKHAREMSMEWRRRLGVMNRELNGIVGWRRGRPRDYARKT